MFWNILFVCGMGWRGRVRKPASKSVAVADREARAVRWVGAFVHPRDGARARASRGRSGEAQGAHAGARRPLCRRERGSARGGQIHSACVPLCSPVGNLTRVVCLMVRGNSSSGIVMR